MDSYPSVDESFARLHRAAWSVADGILLVSDQANGTARGRPPAGK